MHYFSQYLVHVQKSGVFAWAGWMLGAALLACVSLPFAASTPVWDDIDTLRSFQTHGISSVWRPLFGDYFRPLALVSMWAPWKLGVPQWANTALSIPIFMACAALAASSARAIQGSQAGPAFRGNTLHPWTVCGLCAYFAINPVFAEPQTWFSGRFDAMLTLVSCLLLRMCLAGNFPFVFRALGVFFISGLAGLCKESAIVMAPFWAVFALAAPRFMGEEDKLKKGVSLSACVVLGTACWWLVRALALPEVWPEGFRGANSALESLAWFLEATARYQALWIGSPLESYPLARAQPVGSWLAVVGGAVGITASVVLVIRGWRTSRAWMALLGLTLMQAIPLGMLSATHQLSAESFIAPRNMAPVLAWGAAALPGLAGAIARRWGSRWAKMVVVLVLASCAIQAIPARSAWRSNLSLWLASDAAVAGDRLATIQLGYALLEAGRYEQAIRIEEAYLRVHPEVGLAQCHPHEIIGRARQALGQSIGPSARGFESYVYCSAFLVDALSKEWLEKGECSKAVTLLNLALAAPAKDQSPFHGLWVPSGPWGARLMERRFRLLAFGCPISGVD